MSIGEQHIRKKNKIKQSLDCNCLIIAFHFNFFTPTIDKEPFFLLCYQSSSISFNANASSFASTVSPKLCSVFLSML